MFCGGDKTSSWEKIFSELLTGTVKLMKSKERKRKGI